MQNIGESFIVVNEPKNFDMKRGQVFFNDFSFVFCSESQFLRDSVVKLIRQCHQIRQRGLSAKLLTSVKKTMKKNLRTSCKTERDFLELVAVLFDLAYYNATSHDKDTHLRSFTSIIGGAPRFFCYVGSKDYNSLQIIEKLQEKMNNYKEKAGAGSFITLTQVVN